MKIVSRILMPLVATLIVVAAGGCTATVTNTNTSTATNTNANTTSNANTATAPATVNNVSSNNVTVTLPLLDAMFTEESFASDLKSRLQLTDEQVTRLRNVAREATSKLRESNDGNSHQGTTAAARAQAEEQIKATIGPEKSQQLTAFVGERYSGAVAGASQPAISPIASAPADTRIVVNAPAFRMDVFQNGQLVKTYRVAIGYPEFPLPVGMRKADTIIFNPTWTPPDEPWVEAPGSQVKVGETVKAGDKLNPLGPIKIPIGSPSLIHGGKTSAKIGSYGSHGCVGLTNGQVQDFARLLAQAGGANLTDAQVAEYQKNKTETKNVKLAAAVPVELRYDTITVEDGKLHIYRDVYDKDTNTEENLRSVLQGYGVQLEQLSQAERAQVMNGLKEMSRDPSGKLDSPGGAAMNANAKNDNAKNGNANSNSKKATNTSPKVTRTIKGQKEVVIEIAALQGKGYPAPVNLDTGGAATEDKASSSKKKKR